ncbi:deaminase domain-containing protein [Paenibacillus sp. FSL R10-2736]|uniref:deaminase domain-containing protein n=1 Tax=Paenibacillus sp. FSL R10-2736 TaxID=2954692 RepID=UPI0030F86FB5
MSSRKLIFNGDEVQRLQTRVGQVSQDTNRLYLQLKGQSSGWDGIPLGDRLVKAQVMINELTVEAEKLEDIIRVALKGITGLQEENKRQADKLTQQFSLLAGAFGSIGTSNTAGGVSIPAIVQKSVSHLITSVTVLLGKDELNNDPAVQKLRNIIQTSGLLTVEGIAALSKLKDIFAARDGIAKAQMAFKVYEAFGNKTQMEAVHAQAEEARQKLASLGVAKVQYEAGKDLSSYFKQPAVKACDYDPSITAESVPLIHNEEYLLLLRMAMEKSAAGNYARSQLEVKRLQIEAAERKLALDSNTEAKKYNFEEYSKTLIGNTWVLSKNGITDQEAAQASIAYQEAVRNGEIKSNLDNVPVDIMQEQILAAKDGTNYWTGAKLSKLQAYGIIISSVVASFQGIEGMRGNVTIKRSLPLNPGAGEISASRVKKLNVPVSEGTGENKLPNRTIDSLYEKTQNVRGDINREIEKIRNSDEYKNLSKTQRDKLDRKLRKLSSGNVAVADVNIPGIQKGFQAHSQIHSSDSVGSNVGDFSSSKVDKSLETYVDDEFPRFNDTEAKILEDIASQIKDPNVKGRIDLFTELDACQSCSNLIMEFRRKFPNIELNVYSKNMK